MEESTYTVACVRANESEREVACCMTLKQASDLADEYAHFDKGNVYVVLDKDGSVVWGLCGQRANKPSLFSYILRGL